VERSVKYKVAGLEARRRCRIARAQGTHRAIPPLLADLFSILLESSAMPVQTFTGQVESIENLTHDVRRLDLRLIEPKTIAFKPGQFISFEMPDPQTGRLLTRAYSIASQPNRSGVITLLFNLVSGGPGSGFLFHLKAGEKTQFKGPAGHFYLRDDPNRELLFVASGTGIAPIRSMMLANAERSDPRPATLFWGLRSQQDLYDQEELAELTRRIPTFTAVTTLSRPDPGWSGSSGRVLRLIEERITSVENLAVYLCGNSAMISDATSLLQKKGLCPIYREKYYDGGGDGA
jgi:NAD(P)H-flavin reductase